MRIVEAIKKYCIGFAIIALAVVLNLACNKQQNNESLGLKIVTKDRPKSFDSTEFIIQKDEDIGSLAMRLKLHIAKENNSYFPTDCEIQDINKLLSNSTLRIDYKSYFLYFKVKEVNIINFKYIGSIGKYYAFNTVRCIMLIGKDKNEKYIFTFSPETLFGKSRLQAVFKVDNFLMPISSIKKKLPKDDFIAEKYPYIDKYGMDFIVLSYKNKVINIDFDKIKVCDLDSLFNNKKLFQNPDTVFFRNGRLFLNYPLWDDSGGFYPF